MKRLILLTVGIALSTQVASAGAPPATSPSSPPAGKAAGGEKAAPQPRAAVKLLITMGVTLNPDGSGKAAVEVRRSPPPGSNYAGDMGTFALGPGVDAWSDLSVGKTPEGLLFFKGTAYFKGLEKLKILGWPPDVSMTWTQDLPAGQARPKGGMVLAARYDFHCFMPTPVPPKMTEEELAKKVEAFRGDWKQVERELKEPTVTCRVTYSFKLPGPAEVSGFKKAADGSLLFEHDRNRILKALFNLAADEDYVRDFIRGGRMPLNDKREPLFMENAFGSKGPFAARVTGEMKPQFDYAAEVKAAKEAYSKKDEAIKSETKAVMP